MKNYESDKMFTVNTEELIERLEIIRKRLCVYIGNRCDCKFGINENSSSLTSENSGCPEIRQAIEMIKNFTKEN